MSGRGRGLGRVPFLVQGVGLVAALEAAVALALKVPLEHLHVCLAELTGHGGSAILPDDTVGQGVQVQVNITVWVSAQAAAVGTTQGLAAQLCCCGNVDEVLTQWTTQILVKVQTAGLWRGKKNRQPP